jgi:hypothetical protein
MKIIISEQQLRSIFSESYDEDKINYLLDKINAAGMNSLSNDEKETLNRISQGKEVEREEQPDHDTHYDHRDDEDSYSMNDQTPFDKSISPEYMDPTDPDESDSHSDAMNLLGMFMYFTPEYEEININDSIWHVEIVETNNNEQHLHVANAENDFYVTPFWESENSVTIETNDGKTNRFKLNNVPTNEKEMKQFVRSFYSHILPKIIKTVVH